VRIGITGRIEMIITKFVMRKGHKIAVAKLGKASRFKVDVQCPECDKIRTVHYRSIRKAGHCICQACVMRKRAKHLPIGRRYGRLVVLSSAEQIGFSLCECNCGNIITVRNRNLITRMTKSCGCLKKDSFQNAVKVKGIAHGMWKGGTSSERERIMQSGEYKKWREFVYARDYYTCRHCGQVGYKLNAHHIRSFADEVELRIDIDNGLTLCEKCHRQYHHLYGRNNISSKQLYEFLGSQNNKEIAVEASRPDREI